MGKAAKGTILLPIPWEDVIPPVLRGGLPRLQREASTKPKG